MYVSKPWIKSAFSYWWVWEIAPINRRVSEVRSIPLYLSTRREIPEEDPGSPACAGNGRGVPTDRWRFVLRQNPKPLYGSCLPRENINHGLSTRSCQQNPTRYVRLSDPRY